MCVTFIIIRYILLSPALLSCFMWARAFLITMMMKARGLLQEKWEIRHARTKDAHIICAVHTTAIRQLGNSHFDSKEISQWIQRRITWNYQPFIAKGEIFMAVYDKTLIGFGRLYSREVRALHVSPDSVRKSWKCLTASCIWRNWRRKRNVKIWLSSLLWMLQHLSESQLCHMQ